MHHQNDHAKKECATRTVQLNGPSIIMEIKVKTPCPPHDGSSSYCGGGTADPLSWSLDRGCWCCAIALDEDD